MRWLPVLALLGAVACGSALAEPPDAPEAMGSAAAKRGASDTAVRPSTDTEPLGTGEAARVKLSRQAPATDAHDKDHQVKAHASADTAGRAPAAPNDGFAQPVVPREQTVVRVLLYHGIGKKTTRPTLRPRSFEQQLDWLHDNDIEVIRLSQLLDFLEGELLLPSHVAVITIDDGEVNGYSAAFPILAAHRMPFSLGIATDAIERSRERGALSWAQIREMVASGWCEVASHSVTHRRMTALPDEVARRELVRSRLVLTEALGQSPDAFFYPLGAQDHRIRRLTKLSGYRAAFVAHGGPTVAKTPRFGIPRYDVKPGVSMRTFRSFFNHEIRMSGSVSERVARH